MRLQADLRLRGRSPSRPLPRRLSRFHSLDRHSLGKRPLPAPPPNACPAPKSGAHASLRGGWPAGRPGGPGGWFFSSSILQGPGRDFEAAGTRSLSLGGPSAAPMWLASGGGAGREAWSWCSFKLRPAVRNWGHMAMAGAGRPRRLGLLPCWALRVLAIQRPPPTCLARPAPAATGGRLSGSHCAVGLRWFFVWRPGIWPAVPPSDPLSPHSGAPRHRPPRESAGSWAEPPVSDRRNKGSTNCLVKKPGRKKNALIQRRMCL